MFIDNNGVLQDWNDNQVSPCYFRNINCDQDSNVIGM